MHNHKETLFLIKLYLEKRGLIVNLLNRNDIRVHGKGGISIKKGNDFSVYSSDGQCLDEFSSLMLDPKELRDYCSFIQNHINRGVGHCHEYKIISSEFSRISNIMTKRRRVLLEKTM